MRGAEETLAEQTNDELLGELREQAAGRLDELRDEIDHINEQLQVAAGDHVDLPKIEVPEPRSTKMSKGKPWSRSTWTGSKRPAP